MQILGYYIHDLDPFVFRIGGFGPRWYGLAYLMGFLVAWLLIRKQSRDGMLRLRPDLVTDLVLNCCIFGVLIGGRLGFVLFYDLPEALRAGRVPLLWNFSDHFPFWGVLKVWDGGMSAHGGVLFTVLTLAFFAWKYKASLVNIGDAACMVVPIGLCFGRIANFINGELYGHPSTVPWAVKFPSEIWSPTNGVSAVTPAGYAELQDRVGQFVAAHPMELTAQQVGAFLTNHPDVRADISRHVGGLQLSNLAHLEAAKQAIGEYLGQHASELYSGDYAQWWQQSHSAVGNVMREVFEKILPSRHPSQLYEALLEGVLLFAICWTVGRLWRKDGMAGGAFLTLYPVMRILGEQFRVGDTPQNVLGMQISMGTIYSLPMFLIGVVHWGPPVEGPPDAGKKAGAEQPGKPVT